MGMSKASYKPTKMGTGHADLPRQSALITDELIQQLRKAKLDAKRRRLQISGATFCVCVVCAGISLYISFLTSSRSPYRLFRICDVVAIIFGLLSILPTDVHLVQVAGLLLFACNSLIMVKHAFVVRQYFCSQTCHSVVVLLGAETEIPCWIAYASLVGYLWSVLVKFGISSVGIRWTLTRSSPRKLKRLWMICSWWCFHAVVMHTLWVAEYVFLGVPALIWSSCVSLCAYSVVGFVVRRPNFRSSVHSLLASYGATTTAAGVAVLLGASSCKHVLSHAKHNFLAVSLDKVEKEDMAINTPDATLARFATKSSLGCVDAFISHSWHDNSELKWAELQTWRRDFKAQYGREPRVWIDKYCIDQQSVDQSLACLPVFLAGCRKLVIFCGETYLQRLWCIVELMAFLEMGGSIENIELRVVVPRHPLTNQKHLFSNIDLKRAECSSKYDTERLQAALEASTSGMQGLHNFVQTIVSSTVDLC